MSIARLLPLSLILFVLVGCGPTTSQHPTDPKPVVKGEQLKKQIDEVLDFTYLKRHLNTEDHAAWQIMHGVLAFGKPFKIRVGRDGKFESAVEYALSGRPMKGWSLRPGDPLDADGKRTGVVALTDFGSKAGQGHTDQWLGYTSESGLTLETPVTIGTTQFTLADWLDQAKRDVSRNELQEYTWTLMMMAIYLPSDASWTAADGKTWSIERLVEHEAKQDINKSACGGSHRLYGLASAVNHHVAAGGKLTGGWQAAKETIDRAVKQAKEYQNADGSFSSNYFSGPGSNPDLKEMVGTTGHTLEFLALTLSPEELKEEWMQRAAAKLCDLFRKTKSIDLECAALFHASHGLMLYRQKVFGDRELPAWTAE